jgi:VanZ family protein
MTRSRGFPLALFAAACLVVAYLSLAPGGTIPHAHRIDKALHVVGYAGLVWLGGLACAAWRARIGLAAALLGYGGLLELFQDGLPRHQASLLDMAANLGGLFAGLVALALTDLAVRRLAARVRGAAQSRLDPADR